MPTEADPRIRACIVNPSNVKIALMGFVLSGRSKPPKPVRSSHLLQKDLPVITMGAGETNKMDLTRTLKTHFGYDQFRPLQREIISDALEDFSDT